MPSYLFGLEADRDENRIQRSRVSGNLFQSVALEERGELKKERKREKGAGRGRLAGLGIGSALFAASKLLKIIPTPQSQIASLLIDAAILGGLGGAGSKAGSEVGARLTGNRNISPGKFNITADELRQSRFDELLNTRALSDAGSFAKSAFIPEVGEAGDLLGNLFDFGGGAEEKGMSELLKFIAGGGKRF